MHSTRNIILAAVVTAFAASPALAGNGNGNGHGKHGGKHADKHHVEKHGGRHRGDDRVVRHDDRRDRRGDHHAYYDDHRRAGCPPGLAKKHNGCMPPGQAKKVGVGYPVPPGAVYTIPRHVRTQLPPAPAGYRYAIVNNQVVLVSSGNLIADIVLNLLG